MERFCGTLLPAVKSRRFPYASLSNYITEVAQIKQISLIYNLEEVLALRARNITEETPQYAEHGCKWYSLVTVSNCPPNCFQNSDAIEAHG